VRTSMQEPATPLLNTKCMARKSISERREATEKRLEQVKARLVRLKMLEGKEDRRQRTRRLIVLGAYLDNRLDRKDVATWLIRELQKDEHRASDRESLQAVFERAKLAAPQDLNGKEWKSLRFAEPIAIELPTKDDERSSAEATHEDKPRELLTATAAS